MHWREEPVFRGTLTGQKNGLRGTSSSSTKANENWYVWEERNNPMAQGRPEDDW